jgi:hypothetical protein
VEDVRAEVVVFGAGSAGAQDAQNVVNSGKLHGVSAGLKISMRRPPSSRIDSGLQHAS